MSKVAFDENSTLGRLIASLGPFGFVAIDPDRVNIKDLVSEDRPGKIVRTFGNPNECIAVFAAPYAETLGCVAGWISEGE